MDTYASYRRNGYANLAITFRKLIETEKETPGTREEKLQAARDRFYKGDIADELVAFYIKNGGFLRKIDLAAHVTRVEEPLLLISNPVILEQAASVAAGAQS